MRLLESYLLPLCGSYKARHFHFSSVSPGVLGKQQIVCACSRPEQLSVPNRSVVTAFITQLKIIINNVLMLQLSAVKHS